MGKQVHITLKHVVDHSRAVENYGKLRRAMESYGELLRAMESYEYYIQKFTPNASK